MNGTDRETYIKVAKRAFLADFRYAEDVLKAGRRKKADLERFKKE